MRVKWLYVSVDCVRSSTFTTTSQTQSWQLGGQKSKISFCCVHKQVAGSYFITHWLVDLRKPCYFIYNLY